MSTIEDCGRAYREAEAELILAQQSLKAAHEALEEAEDRAADARAASRKAAEMLLDLARGESA